MELKFLGRGAAFNPKEGNTSAYFIDSDELFLLDCGSSIFERLVEKNILNNLKAINIFITHLHGDHVGSLATLIDYAYHILSTPVYIISNSIITYDIESFLKYMGITTEKYSLRDTDYYKRYSKFKNVSYIKTIHTDRLSCYSIIFDTKDGLIYYSGDTKELDTLTNLLNQNLYKAYIDTNTSDNPNSPHISIKKLSEVIPKKQRNKIYCMHINNDECIELIKKHGFNIVENK